MSTGLQIMFITIGFGVMIFMVCIGCAFVDSRSTFYEFFIGKKKKK